MCGHNYYDVMMLLFEGLSAIGTCGAVIFSLWVLFDSKKIKYIIKAESIAMTDNISTDIGVNISLTNNSKDNLIKISSFPKIKLKKQYMCFKPNLQEYSQYKFPSTLAYGDTLNFFLDQKQIELILKEKNKNFLFFFNDSLGNTYKIKIKRDLFKNQSAKNKEN